MTGVAYPSMRSTTAAERRQLSDADYAEITSTIVALADEYADELIAEFARDTRKGVRRIAARNAFIAFLDHVRVVVPIIAGRRR